MKSEVWTKFSSVGLSLVVTLSIACGPSNQLLMHDPPEIPAGCSWVAEGVWAELGAQAFHEGTEGEVDIASAHSSDPSVLDVVSTGLGTYSVRAISPGQATVELVLVGGEVFSVPHSVVANQTGCPPGTTQTSPQSGHVQEDSPAEPAEEYTLVWDNAPLSQTPTSTEPIFRRTGWSDEQRSTRAGELSLFGYRGVDGDRVELVTVPDEPEGYVCADSPVELRDFALRLFVDPTDQGLATTQPVDVTLADGTGFRLRSGVALVRATEASSYLVNTPKFHFNADTVPNVGTVFPVTGGDIAMPDDPEEWLEITWGTPLHLGPYEVTARPAPVEQLLVKGLDERDGLTLVTINDQCSVLVIATDPEAVSSAGIWGVGTGGGAGAGAFAVEEGTAIWWPDGSEAGSVRAYHSFSQSPRQTDDLACFEIALHSAPTEHTAPAGPSALEICFRPADVIGSE